MNTDLFGAETTSDALVSGDGRYRYWLTRTWGTGPYATFVMLNPSTADAAVDDPTIRRCVGFAKSWGCAGLNVVNLYALRSTDPKGLWLAEDPVGPECDRYLASFAATAAHFGTPLIAAWGANAKPERVAHVLRLNGMQALTALGVTKDGAPRHPLYLRSDAQPEPWGGAS